MAKGKNRDVRTQFKDYEGRKPNDKHIRMTNDMMCDPAYKGLSSNAKVLFQYMKLWASGKDTVKYSVSMATDIIASNKTVIKARNELVEKGFIEYINSHRARGMRETAEYKFSDKWKQYKTPAEPKPKQEKPKKATATEKKQKLSDEAIESKLSQEKAEITVEREEPAKEDWIKVIEEKRRMYEEKKK